MLSLVAVEDIMSSNDPNETGQVDFTDNVFTLNIVLIVTPSILT